jgi:cytochrome c oxidase assembly protein subunit 15
VGVTLAVLVCAQVALGIANVRLGLPLHLAVAHKRGRRAVAVRAGLPIARIRAPEA